MSATNVFIYGYPVLFLIFLYVRRDMVFRPESEVDKILGAEFIGGAALFLCCVALIVFDVVRLLNG